MRSLLIAGSLLGLTLAMPSQTPHDPNCVLNGFWQFSGDIIVRFRKVSADGDWNATFYPRSQWLWYYDEAAPKEERLQISQNTTQSPHLFLCSEGRSDTSPPYAMPSTMWWGTSQESMWGGLPSGFDPATYQWTEADNTSSWDPSPQLCPVADILTLLGQTQTIIESGGCDNINVKHLIPELAPLDQVGYEEVAGYGWYYGMEIFVRRVVAARGWQITSESDLKGFVQCYVGSDWQTFAHMIEELSIKPWITRGAEEASKRGFLAR